MTMAARISLIGASLLCGAASLGGCAHARAPNKLEAPLERAMKRLSDDHPSIPGIIVAASSPRMGLDWEGAIGVVDRNGKDPLKPSDAFSIASVTKVFTSATVFRAIEEGKFGLYDPIGPLLSPETAAVLKKDRYDLEQITVFQLLTHTSGVYDFATDKDWGNTIRSNPMRNWSRLEQIEYATEHGDKMFEPGTDYSYSDTGYSLLSEIVERGTGMPFPEAVAKLVDYKKLGLEHTHFDKLEAPLPGERRAQQYVGTINANQRDPSTDLYGAGGIITTVGDLVRFIRPLMQGKIFKDSATLPTSLLVPSVGKARVREHAALLYTARLGKRTCWVHSGWWMVELIYCPDIDLALAVTTNQNIFVPEKPDVGASADILKMELGKAIDELVETSKQRAPKH
ncbi:MAG: class A beta-lactamase-related serine hydrolase [Sphingomonadales bacterium]|nr:MAG: class A beta-lactamase-related serine hydrolase [Sphingomonadales bacterium]